MTTTKKLTIAVVALALSLVLVVGGTLAFLVAKSNTVTNTFTYGDIQIELWETDHNNQKTFTGVEYPNIVPGAEVDKNPTVTVKANSEACYVFVAVTNNVVLNNTPVANYTANANWILVETQGTTTLYRYNPKVEKSTNDIDLPAVFEKLEFADILTVENVKTLKENAEAQIVIKAYAHQADNTDVTTATNAAIAWAFSTN